MILPLWAASTPYLCHCPRVSVSFESAGIVSEKKDLHHRRLGLELQRGRRQSLSTRIVRRGGLNPPWIRAIRDTSGVLDIGSALLCGRRSPTVQASHGHRPEEACLEMSSISEC